MSLIKRALSDRPVAPDLPGITRFINEELKPLIGMLRNAVNAKLLNVVELPQYTTATLPTLSADVRAQAWDTTTASVKTWNGAAWV